MYWLLVPSLQIQTLELNMKIMRNAPNPYNRKVAKTVDYNRSFFYLNPWNCHFPKNDTETY